MDCFLSIADNVWITSGTPVDLNQISAFSQLGCTILVTFFSFSFLWLGKFEFTFNTLVGSWTDYWPCDLNWRWRHNFPRKVSLDFSQIRGSRIRERRKKKRNLCFSQKLNLLKRKINRCFLLLSLLEPLMQSNWDANFLGRLWIHKRFWITWGIIRTHRFTSYSCQLAFYIYCLASSVCAQALQNFTRIVNIVILV